MMILGLIGLLAAAGWLPFHRPVPMWLIIAGGLMFLGVGTSLSRTGR